MGTEAKEDRTTETTGKENQKPSFLAAMKQRTDRLNCGDDKAIKYRIL
jgi:hypothetical protein